MDLVSDLIIGFERGHFEHVTTIEREVWQTFLYEFNYAKALHYSEIENWYPINTQLSIAEERK